jgi:hypothetical protein
VPDRARRRTWPYDGDEVIGRAGVGRGVVALCPDGVPELADICSPMVSPVRNDDALLKAAFA